MNRRFAYVPVGGYAPLFYGSAPDADSADGSDDHSSPDYGTVYYPPAPPAPYYPAPAPAPRVSPAPPTVAAAPVVPRSVKGQVWKYTHDGQTTYTNIQPPASSGATRMFSYAESCMHECTYVTDR